jgi:peptide/nickel transport system substrate-binding protein
MMLVSCRGEETAAPPAPALPESPADGGRVTRRLENDVTTLNYLLHTTDYERYVLSLLHDPLVELDRNLRPIPGTAARWEVGDDGRSLTFHLDPRATFSDGQPVRASDVLFTILKAVDEESLQFASFFEGLDRAASNVLDQKSVRFVFRAPRAGLIYAFNIAVLPEHVYGKGNFKNDFNDKVVGNGPYRLAAREPGKSIQLERRNDYWREKPHVQTVFFRVISDDAVAWMAAKRGEIDEMRVKSDLWAREKDRPDVRDRFQFFDTWNLQYNCIAWNNKDEALRDPRVRRALAMAYDRQSIIRNLYQGQARPVTGPFTPDQWAYDGSVTPVPYDPNAARALLSEAGWGTKKVSFSILVPAGSRVALEQAQAYQQTLKAIGVELDIRAVDGATMFEHVLGGNYQAAFMAWSNDPDPDLFALFHSSQAPPNGMNVVRYASAEADRLIEKARGELDASRRRELLHRLHAVIAADQPYLFTVQVASKWAVSRRIRDVHVSDGFGLFFWHPGPKEWWIAQ